MDRFVIYDSGNGFYTINDMVEEKEYGCFTNEELVEEICGLLNQVSQKNFIYVFETYMFYEDTHIAFISENYSKVKELFDATPKVRGHGYRIVKYECEKTLERYNESIDWIEVNYEGKVKDLKME